MTRKKATVDFEQSMLDLENLVTKMEQGNLSLQESVQTFEEGIKLINQCQDTLTKAEQKVQILIDENLQTINPQENQD